MKTAFLLAPLFFVATMQSANAGFYDGDMATDASRVQAMPSAQSDRMRLADETKREMEQRVREQSKALAELRAKQVNESGKADWVRESNQRKQWATRVMNGPSGAQQ